MRRQDGSATVELAMLAPVLILLMLFVVYAGRVVEAKADVVFAAAEAARAASLTGPSEAHLSATQSVAANIDETGLMCSALDIEVDTTMFEPGGWVSVTVACVTDLSDLTLLNVPGTRVFTATSSEVIDVYRARGASEP